MHPRLYPVQLHIHGDWIPKKMISLASLARDHEKGIKEMVAVKLQTSQICKSLPVRAYSKIMARCDCLQSTRET